MSMESPGNRSPAAGDSSGTGRGMRSEELKRRYCGVLPHINILSAHTSCQLLSLVTSAGGASLGGQKELRSEGGSHVKIAFYVYFNFRECRVNRVKAGGLQQFLFTWAALTHSGRETLHQGVVFPSTAEPTPGWQDACGSTHAFLFISCHVLLFMQEIRFDFRHCGRQTILYIE